MTMEEMFAEADARGLRLNHFQQYSYLSGGVRHHDHWECSFRTEKSELIRGGGRSPQQALADALKIATPPAPKADLSFLD
jgi:hypothetical protein